MILYFDLKVSLLLISVSSAVSQGAVCGTTSFLVECKVNLLHARSRPTTKARLSRKGNSIARHCMSSYITGAQPSSTPLPTNTASSIASKLNEKLSKDLTLATQHLNSPQSQQSPVPHPSPSSTAITMSGSGSGGFYKYRCKYFYTHNCSNWVYVSNAPCATCLVSRSTCVQAAQGHG